MKTISMCFPKTKKIWIFSLKNVSMFAEKYSWCTIECSNDAQFAAEALRSMFIKVAKLHVFTEFVCVTIQIVQDAVEIIFLLLSFTEKLFPGLLDEMGTWWMQGKSYLADEVSFLLEILFLLPFFTSNFFQVEQKYTVDKLQLFLLKDNSNKPFNPSLLLRKIHLSVGSLCCTFPLLTWTETYNTYTCDAFVTPSQRCHIWHACRTIRPFLVWHTSQNDIERNRPQGRPERRIAVNPPSSWLETCHLRLLPETQAHRATTLGVNSRF